MKLKYSSVSEACVQGEFYHQCRVRNIPCYLEYTYEDCRFDAVIYNKETKEIFSIVEFKSYYHKYTPARTDTRQVDKYLKFNLPIMYVVRLSEIEWALNYIEEKIIDKKHEPIIITKNR